MKAARLNGSLVVRRSDPNRCRGGGGSKIVRLQEVSRRAAAAPTPAAPQAGSPPITACDERVRLSLRLNSETHRRLRLLAAYKQQNIQDILASAVSAYLEDARPQKLSDLSSLLAGNNEAEDS